MTIPTATFRQIPAKLATQLLDFVHQRNIGKSVNIDGQRYTLDHISKNSSKFYRGRSLSIYFRTGRSVIRISDHWSQSNGNDRSVKLNCRFIDEHWWAIDNDGSAPLSFGRYTSRFPWRMLAGKCGLSTLNKTCDHWID